MASVALLLDRAVEDRLIVQAIEHGHTITARPASAREFIAIIDGISVDIVVAGGSATTLDRDLLALCDARGIRLIVLAANAAERSRASALGLHDVLDSDARWDDVEAAFVVQVGRPVFAPTRAEVTGSGVIAVWGPAGAPGRTSLAIGIAAEIATSGRRVLLVDADCYGGTVAPALGMLDEAPGFAAACRLAGAGALTSGELDRIAQHYGSRAGSFRVLTGIARASRWPELGASKVASVIEACRRWVDVVVVDTGFSLENDEEISSDLYAPRRNGATLAALRAADRIVAVGSADPIGIPRLLRGHAELLEVVDGAPVDVVVNRLRAGAIGADAGAQVRSTIRRFSGIDTVHLVPDDQRGFDSAVLAGRTLPDAAPRSLARVAIAAFVADALLPAPPTRQRGRAVRRAGHRLVVPARGVPSP